MNNNENYLSEKQILKKKQMLLQLKKEIQNIEHKIENPKLYNFKNNMIKNLKISSKFMQRVAPYVLTAGIMTGVWKVAGLGLPFYYGDELKKDLKIKKTFDSLGNFKYEQQYDEFEDDDNILYLYSEWEKDSAGFYSRSVTGYELSKLTEKQILELFAKDDIKLNDILGESILNRIEKRNNLTEEELKQKDYLQAVIYDKDKNEVIMIKETLSENFIYTLFWILATIFSESFVLIIRAMSDYNYKKCIEKIEDNYSDIDINELKQKLAIKKSNYNRLMR